MTMHGQNHIKTKTIMFNNLGVAIQNKFIHKGNSQIETTRTKTHTSADEYSGPL